MRDPTVLPPGRSPPAAPAGMLLPSSATAAFPTLVRTQPCLCCLVSSTASLFSQLRGAKTHRTYSCFCLALHRCPTAWETCPAFAALKPPVAYVAYYRKHLAGHTRLSPDFSLYCRQCQEKSVFPPKCPEYPLGLCTVIRTNTSF